MLVLEVEVPSTSMMFEFSWVRFSRGNGQHATQKSAGDDYVTDSAALASSSTHVEGSGGRLLAGAIPSQWSSSSSSWKIRRFRNTDCEERVWKRMANEDSKEEKSLSPSSSRLRPSKRKRTAASSQEQKRMQGRSFVQEADISTQT